MTSRRRVVLALAAALAAPGATPGADRRFRIGVLEAGSESSNRHFIEALRTGLREHGYDEGRNLTLDVRWAEGRAERFAPLLNELSQHRPDVIVVASSLGAVAARNVVHAIPVVFVGVSDPVALGVVQNLARPSGNITGLSRVFGEGLLGKALQLLRDIVPGIGRAAILFNPSGAVEARVAEAEQAMRTLSITPLRVEMRDAASLDPALASMRRQRADGLLVIADPLTLRHRDAIVRGVAAARVPAVYEFAEFARAGGLIAYSASVPALFERAAVYVDRILKGTPPGEIAVEQPTKFELVINLATARALGLAVPESLLLRADEVIR
jgi:putative ABC transport system substrate-binding protein